MLHSGMLSSFHTAQRCNGKLKNCFSFDHRGLNLFMGPPRKAPHALSSKEGCMHLEESNRISLSDWRD